jgi:hypothetical protein
MHIGGPNIITDKVKEDDMGWACSTYRERKNAYRIFMRNSG